jgi:hypothetical protein
MPQLVTPSYGDPYRPGWVMAPKPQRDGGRPAGPAVSRLESAVWDRLRRDYPAEVAVADVAAGIRRV